MMPSFEESIQRTFGGSVELFKEVAAVFLNTYSDYVTQMDQAVETKDFTLLEHAAHSLKGALLPFGFEDCAAKAFLLEKVGRAQSFSGSEATQMVSLKEELKAAHQSLQNYLAS